MVFANFVLQPSTLSKAIMSLNNCHARAISDNVPAPPPIAITALELAIKTFLKISNPVGKTISAYSLASLTSNEGKIAIVSPSW